MLHLHDLLDQRRAELQDRWIRSLGEARDDAASKERFGAIADDLVRALSRGEPAGEPTSTDVSEEAPMAAEAGLDAVKLTKALGDLHRHILEMAAQAEVEVTASEQLIVVSRMSAEVERTAVRQERASDRRMRRVAHQLRNPLGSALLALTLLRSKVDLGESNRLAEMIERNLVRLQGLIDEAVGDAEA